ncbi:MULTISPECIES: hypothetical protein [unclassified Pseudovibrio]|uniref:hypothetical protein n=1 Tax=unclassified Pseudovibrio TaxID=2627060 RepID=UPI0007AE4506|nr:MULTISPECIES: hypothetical protein [unclassified Pseudovibrio]KZL02281.1 hypothetical protein PsW74_01379 [Pseudovibrio sp. W74]KZL08175.1 hypothetical protein PsAD14_03322 [Pseudovibrio sp. Ad14]
MSEQRFPIEFDRSVTLSGSEIAAAKKLALLLAGLAGVQDEGRDWLAVSTPQSTPQLHALTLLLGCSAALVVLGFAKGEAMDEIAISLGDASREDVDAMLRSGLALTHDVLVDRSDDTAASHRVAKLQAYIGQIQIAA